MLVDRGVHRLARVGEQLERDARQLGDAERAGGLEAEGRQRARRRGARSRRRATPRRMPARGGSCPAAARARWRRPACRARPRSGGATGAAPRQRARLRRGSTTSCSLPLLLRVGAPPRRRAHRSISAGGGGRLRPGQELRLDDPGEHRPRHERVGRPHRVGRDLVGVVVEEDAVPDEAPVGRQLEALLEPEAGGGERRVGRSCRGPGGTRARLRRPAAAAPRARAPSRAAPRARSPGSSTA